jgi:hypothetical protein
MAQDLDMVDGERHRQEAPAFGPTPCSRSASPWSTSPITWRCIDMLVTGIKSKPVYAPLRADRAAATI